MIIRKGVLGLYWYYDTSYFVFVLPAFLFALYAQAKVSSAFNRYSRVMAQRGLTGAEIARRLLNDAGLNDVTVTAVPGRLTDHYDSRSRQLRLSEEVYHRSSLAAVGVAAHEAGHAIQHAVGYSPLAIRNAIIPVAQFGSQLAFPLFFIGFLVNLWPLVTIGVLLFGAAVVFQIITLPVEFNASGRAVALLEQGNYLTSSELPGARAVLNAAALTYVAATAMAIAQFLRLLALSRRRR